jgi:hypothetical protein
MQRPFLRCLCGPGQHDDARAVRRHIEVLRTPSRRICVGDQTRGAPAMNEAPSIAYDTTMIRSSVPT